MKPNRDRLRESAITVLTRREQVFHVKPWRQIMIDSNQPSVLESISGAAVFGGILSTLTTGIDTMAKITPEEKAAKAAEKQVQRDAARAEKAGRAAEAKAQKLADAAAVKEQKAQAVVAAKAAKAEARAVARAEKAANRVPAKSISQALAAKAVNYTKGLNGQLHSGDAVALTLSSIPAGRVVPLLLLVLGLEENPYSTLNYGQQSMNLRNKFRGAFRKDPAVLETLKSVIAESDLTIPPKATTDPLAVTE